MKVKFSEKMKYKSDKIMSKGTPALIILLIITSVLFLILFGFLMFLFAKKLAMPSSSNPVFWDVFIHMLDPGTITADDSGNVGYIVFMVVITLAGLVINSILIGTVSNAIDNKLSLLKEGKSKVLENNHTVIIGLNDSAYTIISELIEANENAKKGCIVVFDKDPQDVLVDKIHVKFPNTKNTEIICRSGNPFELNILDRCSISTAKSIIITYDDDIETIKQLMVISKYIKLNKPTNKDFHTVAIINEEKNLTPAKIVGKDFAEIIYFGNALSRLIAHSCRYPGISKVFVDFFDFDGDEVYYETFPSLESMAFRDVIMSFKNSAVIGLVKDGKPLLNPPMDTIYEPSKGDQVIHLAEDDNVSFPSPIPNVNPPISQEKINIKSKDENKNLLILGYNQLLFDILTEFDKYIGNNSHATLVTKSPLDENIKIPNFNNLHFTKKESDIDDYKNLSTLVSENYDSILLLCDLEMEDSKADASILTKLVTLRYIIKEKGLKINIISEMRSVENQKISSDDYEDENNIGDFVVGSNIMSLVLSQLSENSKLKPLFEDLLDDDGSELYMKPVSDYIEINKKSCINMYGLQRIAEKKNEIVIGYKKFINNQPKIMLNPDKDVMECFCEKDSLIVVAND